MERHATSGNASLGLGLAASTMLLWGMLPLALKGILGRLDPLTITWFRFLVSALLLGGFLALRGGLPRLRGLPRPIRIQLLLATAFLAANYLLYLLGLDHTTPADAQVLIQIAPILLALCGIFVFREPFNGAQWGGFAVLVTGLGIFSAGRLGAELPDLDRHLAGNGLIVGAALTWVVYGVAQKQLLRRLQSQQIMFVIYVGCTLVFAPLATPSSLATLDAAGWGFLVFCSLNTVLAYGCFSESLAHWEASRVSAVLALTPLATLALAEIVALRWPESGLSQVLAPLAWVGALCVVSGSLVTSLAGDGARPRVQEGARDPSQGPPEPRDAAAE